MLPLARYRFQFTVTRPIHLPDWSGSMLRGAFGHALRRLACMTRAKDCAGCPLHNTCPYPAIFAPPAVDHKIQRFSQPPAPYLIEPENWGARLLTVGDTLQFDMVLLGRALRELPLITLAWQQAAQRGLGPGDGTAELTQIQHLTHAGSSISVFNATTNRLIEHPTNAPDAPQTETPDEITLHLLSPLRLQENGRALPPNRLNAQQLLMASVRRASLMAEFHGNGAPNWDFKQLTQQAAAVNSEKDLKWQDWTRRSSRQQQTMQLGGVTGTWTLRGNIQPFLAPLHLGQWLHIGKETVFGLGKYRLEQNPPLQPNAPSRPQQAADLSGENRVEQ